MTKNFLNTTWQKILTQLREHLPKPSFETWLKATYLTSIENNVLTVVVPNHFAKDWLDENYYPLIQEKAESILNQNVTLNFVQAENEIYQQTSNDFTMAKNSPDNSNDSHNLYLNTLNPKYIFETFVVGNSNRFAHAASLAVAESVAKAYNPLFIYGGVGLGKTHLMHAIGNYVAQHHQHYRVLYVTSEKFTNELINSIQNNTTIDFRQKYRNIDLLLIDDIQFLAKKERTQEEFFHTFNTLHEANKQIVISSDRPPREIPTLEDRLRSRFEWGLITDIQPPDLETRIAILRKKSEIENITIPDDVIFYIANRIQSNIRELEGALIRVIAYSSLSNRDITIDLCIEALKNIIGEQKTKIITPDLIKNIVAEHYQLDLNAFKSRRRTRDIAFPRQIAMYLCRELTDLSLPKIGEEFGGRDHTTVIHAHERIANEIKKNPPFETTIYNLIQTIKKG